MSFDCSENCGFNDVGTKIIDIFKSSVILGDNHLTAFGGFSFDMNDNLSKIWSDIPKGRLMIPRYYFSNTNLSINMLLNKNSNIESKNME